MPDALGSALTDTNPNSLITLRSDRLGKPWKASDKIKTFIGIWESGRMEGTTRIVYTDRSHIDVPVSGGMILVVYRDDRGNPTVGCGHLVLPDDNLQLGQTITVARARDLLEKDLQRMEGAINRNVKVPLHQYEYDALVSICFNAGGGGAAVEIAHRVNQGDYQSVPHYITGFRCRNPRLRQRRSTEARVFAQGVYDATH
ncbi:lysozyme [Paraburkholderia sprentiae WSM5005]|uniref:Lysozyme n=1 Tax=Paraburkholderia sprentiae WSM5005 TaxID=754502 RepID=A0A8F4KHN0_9BURK|nr:lysozyme [Paraburkholderia sprentiae]QXE07299.1 lysozyme [Paraburkholderia sprentiae WSM5005]